VINIKKTKTVDTYYCDYCGRECQHTPLYTLPSSEQIKEDLMLHGNKTVAFVTGEEIKTKQKDICPDCQKKIATLLKLVPRVEFPTEDINSMRIIF
jgi:ribosomal protein L37AE/L43A